MRRAPFQTWHQWVDRSLIFDSFPLSNFDISEFTEHWSVSLAPCQILTSVSSLSTNLWNSHCEILTSVSSLSTYLWVLPLIEPWHQWVDRAATNGLRVLRAPFQSLTLVSRHSTDRSSFPRRSALLFSLHDAPSDALSAIEKSIMKCDGGLCLERYKWTSGGRDRQTDKETEGRERETEEREKEREWDRERERERISCSIIHLPCVTENEWRNEWMDECIDR